MTQFLAALAWIPAHLTGPDGVLTRTGEHVVYTILTLLIAVAIAVPIGLAIGHVGRGRLAAVQVSSALRALPTLGLVLLLALLLGLGLIAPLIALVILAIPPILAAAYAGPEAVERTTIDAARAVGMTEWQILMKVELPLGLPILIGGLRSATLQAIATWTVAAILPVGGLGRYIFDGLPVQDYPQMLGGSIVVIVLALVADGIFAIIQRVVVPRGVAADAQPEGKAPAPRRGARSRLSTNETP